MTTFYLTILTCFLTLPSLYLTIFTFFLRIARNKVELWDEKVATNFLIILFFYSMAEMVLTLIIITNVSQMSILEWFLKDHVTLKTGVMMLEIHLNIYSQNSYFKL